MSSGWLHHQLKTNSIDNTTILITLGLVIVECHARRVTCDPAPAMRTHAGSALGTLCIIGIASIIPSLCGYGGTKLSRGQGPIDFTDARGGPSRRRVLVWRLVGACSPPPPKPNSTDPGAKFLKISSQIMSFLKKNISPQGHQLYPI
jgi:hypothetical protein